MCVHVHVYMCACIYTGVSFDLLAKEWKSFQRGSEFKEENMTGIKNEVDSKNKGKHLTCLKLQS